jgi:integrase
VTGPDVRHRFGPGERSPIPDATRSHQPGQLMARPKTGSVFEKPWADGETISHGAYFYAYGRREKVTFGTNRQGWSRRRAELEAEKIRQQIERETWVPPRLQPRKDRQAQVMADLGVSVDESFRVFAKRWWASKRLGVRPKTVSDYEWRLSYLDRFFSRYKLRETTPRMVDRFRDELREQTEVIRTAADRAAADPRRRALIETVTDQRGRTYERRRRARGRGTHRPPGPGPPGDDRHARPRRVADQRDARSALRPGRPGALTVQAPGCQDAGRGPRGRDDDVRARRAARLHDGPPCARAAGRSDRLLLRHRPRRPARPRPLPRPDPLPTARPRERRAREPGPAGAGSDHPHSLRRTWATFCAQIGRDPKWVSAQIGHTDPEFTFSVYRQVSTRRYVDEQAIWTVMRFADEPEEKVPSRQMTRAADSNSTLNSTPELKGPFGRFRDDLENQVKDPD